FSRDWSSDVCSSDLGFSLVMEAFVIALCQAMPVAHVARLVGVSDDRIWRVLRHHVDRARAREDYSAVRRVGVDETSSRRGQRYKIGRASWRERVKVA